MPNTGSAASSAVVGKNDRFTPIRHKSRSSTPVANKSSTRAPNVLNNNDIATAFKSDLTCIRVLVTCSICDQLLYEPWTIACGHTYCYSCLCSWFAQDKRNKSCPECRSKVKAMPAPSFLVKQLVEVIIKRSELTSTDESIEQHQQKRFEEIALVDKDRNSIKGLFQGMFAEKQNSLWRDVSDGVLRCSGCGFEHEGGPICSNCGEQIDDENYDIDDADMQGEELDTMGLDLEVDSENDSFNYGHQYFDHYHRNLTSYLTHHRQHSASLGPGQYISGRTEVEVGFSDDTESEASDVSAASDSSECETDNADDDNSLHDFVVPDDDVEVDEYPEVSSRSRHRQQNISSSIRQRNTVTTSDNETDEGGAVTNRRQRRRHNNSHDVVNLNTMSPVPSVMTITDASIIESERSDHGNETEYLSYSGWSPLEHADDSENNDRSMPHRLLKYDNDTSTETINEGLDGEDYYEKDESLSPTPTLGAHTHRTDFHTYGSPRRGDLESGNAQVMDRDGDTEMSVSPNAPLNSRSLGISGSNSHDSQVGDGILTSVRRKSSDSSLSTDYEVENNWTSPWETSARNNQGSRRIISRGINRTRRRRPGWEATRTLAVEADSRHRRPWTGSTFQGPYRESSHESTGSRLRVDVVTADSHSNNHSSFMAENLGLANEIHELDEESDVSIQRPSGRRPRQYNPNPHISFVLVGHPPILAGSQGGYLYEPEARRVNPGIRIPRMTAYRHMPVRRVDPLRSSMSLSVTRVMATSNRITRLSRPHNTRSFY